MRYIFAILALLLFGVSHADQELPRLGDDARIRLNQERELGLGLYQKLKQAGFVIDDPLATRYLDDIGKSLLSGLDIRLRDYRFFLVRNASVNAFAAPGGFVGVNVGLITMTKSEDELASVLAHEIAHVELAHTMQMIERSQQVNTAGMLSILAAILIGSQNPEAMSAIIDTGAAGSTQAMVNFTRSNEYEADRVGIDLLKKSDYDPQAMADFMGLLQRREQIGEIANMEYIRTHPLSSNRVAEVESRVGGLAKKTRRVTRFRQFQDYLLHLYPDAATDLAVSEFARALALMRSGQYTEATAVLKQLIKNDPDNIWYQYVNGEALRAQSRFAEARQVYAKLLLLYPDDLAITLQQAQVLTELRNYGNAAELLQRSLQIDENQPAVYMAQVELYKRLEKPVLSQLAKANFHWFEGNKEQAKRLYNALLADTKLDLVTAQKIKQKLAAE